MPERGHRSHSAGPDRGHAARPRGRQPARAPGLLAQTIGDSLGYETVAITLYRPAWDDFRVTAVSGREQARETLCGLTRTHDDYRPLLDERFLRRGAYVIPEGAHDWSEAGPKYTPPVEPTPGDPHAWHPEDVLLVPLNATNGSLLGVMSVDEPASLRRPDDDELDVLVAVGEHVALAIEDAQADETASRHAASLKHLLNVSSRLRDSSDVNEILQAVVDNIRRALGFERVSIELTHPDGSGFRPRSSTGWGSAGPPPTGLTPATLAPLLDAEYEIEGCYLLPFEVARPRVTHIRYASALNGHGPHAWNRHWLVVPLTDRDGGAPGLHLAGRPGRPARAAAREDAGAPVVRQPGVRGARVGGALRGVAVPRRPRSAHAAAEPPRVRAPARIETARSLRYGHPFSLVLCDLDEFKELNDRAGHLVGDEELVRFAGRLTDAIRRTDYAFRSAATSSR